MTESAKLRLLDVLERMAGDLVARVDADACVISRVVGDVLIMITQVTTDGRVITSGQGYLVSDFPSTQAVLRTGGPCVLTVADVDADAAETALLQELGYATLLMLPLEVGAERWGLVELYRTGVRPFDAADAAAARTLARL